MSKRNGKKYRTLSNLCFVDILRVLDNWNFKLGIVIQFSKLIKLKVV